MKPTLADNKIRALATSGPTRTEFLPDVPPVGEAGVPGYEVTSWNGVVAPKGTAEAIVNTLNAALREILAIPEVKARYADLGVVAKASSPEELRARLQADIGKWAAVIERAGIPKQ
jgi:tripartite-type tricarboxylate transporter receptor subunit TctC